MRKLAPRSIPVIVEKDEDGLYVVECPVFSGCFSQGKTVKEALHNISEVIELCLEEKENRDLISGYQPKELTLHTISI
ncbi:MAG: type II toxin-antitoxin system HicB family antitoxin [Patescibacteria group bacterium]